jgi:hypothetical protein
MGKGFTVEGRGGYVHVLHVPNYEVTRESMGEVWAELSAVCNRVKCNLVLIEAPSPKRQMDTTAAFETATRIAQIAPGIKMAMLLHDYQTDELTEFFKTVARNRGARIEYFSDKENALDWLGVGQTNTMP